MKCFFIFNLFWLLTFSASSQNVFNRIFDYHDSTGRANAVIQTIDSGFVLTGTGGNVDYLSVLKTNFKGDILRTIFDDLNSGLSGGVIGYTIFQLNNGNIIIGGSAADTNQMRSDAFLMTLNDSGKVIKTIQYGTDSTSERCYDIKQTKDGGLIFIGWQYDVSGVQSDVYLVKTDSSGNVEWETTFGGPDYDFTRALDFTIDGGYILGGSTKSSGLDNYDMYLVKTDSMGNFQWQKTFGSSGSDYANDMLTTSDGGFILAGGYTTDDINDVTAGWLVKTDSAGNLQWEKKYTGSGQGPEFTGIKMLPDGNFVAAGNIYSGKKGIEYKGWLVKVKPDGDTIWTRTYQYFKDTAHHYFYGMDLCKDGGFVMTGMTIDLHKNGTSTGNDMWLVKTDSCGYTVGNSPQPQALFNIDSANGMSVFLKNTTLNGCGYKWHFGDGDTAMALNASHTYKDTGTYIVTLFAYAGDMSDTVSDTLRIYKTGAKEILSPNAENDFLVFHDISNSSIQVKINSFEKYRYETLQFELFDVTGRKVKTRQLLKSQVIIETKTLNAGMYFYYLYKSHAITNQGKLIITK